MAKITFLPFQKETESDGEHNLLQLALRERISISFACGGKGLCGKCRVIVEKGVENIPPPDEEERERLGVLIHKGFRLACQLVPSGDMRVRIPESSISKDMAILTTHTHYKKRLKIIPSIEALVIRKPKTKDNKQLSDIKRIINILQEEYNIKNPFFDISVLKELPATIRRPNDLFTVLVRRKKEIIDIRPGTTDELYGIAVDIGTTTIVGYLMELREGKQLSVHSTLNPQIRYGADVISRIRFSQKTEDGLKELQKLVLNTINEIIRKTAKSAGVPLSRIFELTVVGNTAMHHIFLGLNPDYLPIAPYSPVLCESLDIKAKELGIEISESGYVYLPPLKAGFFGSDAISSVLVSGMHRSTMCALLLDIGTNGEIVLGNRDRLLCCSTAAGPAFEGGHIKWGMRASEGAIEKVKINPSTYEVKLSTIMNRAPVGICGSGIVSLLAEMLRRGLLNPDGSFNTHILSSRFREGEDGMEFIISNSDESASKTEIVITRKDISQIQLAKSAIRSGAEVLMDKMGIDAPDIIFLSGAGGTYIDPRDVIQIGLIPDIPLSNIISIGNGAGLGACMMLTNINKRKEAEKIAQKMEYIELAGMSLFEDLFVDHTNF